MLVTTINFPNTTSNATVTATVAAVRVNWYYSARFWVSFGVAGVIFNFLEAILIYLNRKHRTVFGLTLVSLCIADILGSACFMVAGVLRLIEYKGPLTVTIQPNTSFSTSWRVGHGALFFSVGTSFTHILIIAVQRLFAVLWPIFFKTWFTRKRCVILLIITWVSLFLTGVIGFFFVQAILTTSYYLMLVVGVMLIICYTIICLKSWADGKRRRLITASAGRKSDIEKITSMSLAVTTAFLVCTFPQVIFYLFVRKVDDLTFYHLVNSIISTNPCLDALIYFCFYHDCKNKNSKKQDHTCLTPVSKRQTINSTPLNSRCASQNELRGSMVSIRV